MQPLRLYYRVEPEVDRFVRGDRFVRPWIRRLVRGRPRVGGVDKVVLNLRAGLERIGAEYSMNTPIEQVDRSEVICVLGRGRHSLLGCDRGNPIVAGIGLMTHPAEWPTLCDDYPIVKYLQHSQWTNDIYRQYFGSRCEIWPVGVDTDHWAPSGESKDIDFLVYDKIQWDRAGQSERILRPVQEALASRGLTFSTLRYGSYEERTYRDLLARSRALIFLTEHESQGIACLEGLSSGVPVLAWDQGTWLDPNRFSWGTPTARATSVPYFEERCGERFSDAGDLEMKLDQFLERLERDEFDPRGYVLENLTLGACAQRFVEIVEGVRNAG